MYKVKKDDLTGSLEGFPIEIPQRMVEYQVEQGNEADVTVFQESLSAIEGQGGFNWRRTKEGDLFWGLVLISKRFDIFFGTYPHIWKRAKKGVELIAAERKRQIKEEGYTEEQDAKNNQFGELAFAAACYALPIGRAKIMDLWPWDANDYKPSGSMDGEPRIHELAKAGALIAAEIDRLQNLVKESEETK